MQRLRLAEVCDRQVLSVRKPAELGLGRGGAARRAAALQGVKHALVRRAPWLVLLLLLWRRARRCRGDCGRAVCVGDRRVG